MIGRLRVALVLCLAAAPLGAQSGSPAGPVPVDLLRARRSAVLERMGQGVAVVESGRVRSIEGDYPQDSDYRERNDFFYLTGIEAPGACLLLVAHAGDTGRAVVYLPSRDTLAERWLGSRPAPGPGMAALTGIEDVRPASRAPREITDLVLAPDSPARNGALFLASVPRAGLPLTAALADSAAAQDSPVGVADLISVIAPLRQVKDADELRRLRRAIALTGDGLREAMAAVAPGVWEYELEGILEGRMRRGGAERVGFPTIVGSGPNGTVLHYDTNRRRLGDGELVVLDVGAEFGYYSADITRTVPVSRRFTVRQRRLYELVLATQQAAIDSIHPGTDVGTLNRIARAYMREHSGGLCGPATCDRYWPHGLSHWLGMDVHDVGSYARPLAPGMVLTVEPGIYLPDEGLGIRIEDDVLVTATGHDVLSGAIPRTAEAVERWVSAAR